MTVENFEKLVDDRRLDEDHTWCLSKNFGKVKEGDAIFIYTGDHDKGIIGYASVESVDPKKRDHGLIF